MFKKLVLSVVLPFVLAGCWGDPETGPVDVKYDREVCEYCKMIISDPRFAVEIRQGKGKEIRKFDDMGDAVHWLKIAPWKETAETEIWVRDMTTGKKWLEAKKVWYLSGQHTPMEYGYGAVAQKQEGAVSFAEMRKAIIAHGSTTRCETPNHPHAPDAHDDHNDDEKKGSS